MFQQKKENMIRTTITATEFKNLTWLSLDAITDDIKDIDVLLKGENVTLAIFGEELHTMKVSDYKAIIN